MFVSSLFLYPPEDHTWWMRLIRFAVLGLFFLLLTLWKNGGEKKPWEYKLLRFRWLLLLMMVGCWITMLHPLFPYGIPPYISSISLLYPPVFLFLLSFLASSTAKRLWGRLLPLTRCVMLQIFCGGNNSPLFLSKI